MSRRPKLSLSSGNKVDKKQAPGFEVTASTNRVETAPSATDSAPDHMVPQGSVTGSVSTIPQAAARPDRAEAKPSPTESVPDDKVARGSVIGGGRTVPQAAAWPVSRQFVKVVFVVVAAALSLYLLKRRLL